MLNNLFISIIILFISQSQAQNTNVLELKFLYDDFRYEQVLENAKKLLDRKQPLTIQERIQIHQYSAFAYFDLGQTDSARVHFITLLTLDPEYQLEPLNHSPKLIEFMNTIKDGLNLAINNEPLPTHTTYLLAIDPRPQAALRSVLLPGWGQYYKEQNYRAYAYFSCFILSSGTLLISRLQENKTYDEYMNAGTTSKAGSKYDTYNSWHRLRQYATYTTAAVWLSAFADALITKPFNLQFIPAQDLPGVTLSFQF